MQRILAMLVLIAWTAHGQPVRVLFLGDSYFAGEGVRASVSLPAQVGTLLEASNVEAARPTVVARTGWTASDLQQALAEQPPVPRYDLVFVCIGANDAYRGIAEEAFPGAFAAVLAEAIRCGRGDPRRVLVLSVPDFSGTPAMREQEGQPETLATAIASCNRFVQETASHAGATYVDLMDLTRLAAGNPSLLARDQLHLNAEAYAQWIERLAGPILEVVGPRTP
jgi:acyl-CoA thioesterase-1